MKIKAQIQASWMLKNYPRGGVWRDSLHCINQVFSIGWNPTPVGNDNYSSPGGLIVAGGLLVSPISAHRLRHLLPVVSQALRLAWAKRQKYWFYENLKWSRIRATEFSFCAFGPLFGYSPTPSAS